MVCQHNQDSSPAYGINGPKDLAHSHDSLQVPALYHKRGTRVLKQVYWYQITEHRLNIQEQN